MSDWKYALVNHYLSREAIAKGRFSLAGGGVSDLYIDGRRVSTYPPALRTIVHGMSTIIRERRLLSSDCTLVAPVLSGIPIVVALSLSLDIPFVMDRGAPKVHGLGKRFEGSFGDSMHCLLVDDLITVGSTLTGTIKGLREAGKSVSDAIVVVDREEGGREALEKIGVRLHALIAKEDLLRAVEVQ